MSNEKQSSFPDLTQEQKDRATLGTRGQHQLHILSKKTWNVWNRDNIERVEKDEKEHRENLLSQQKRSVEIAKEKRLSHLRRATAVSSSRNDIKKESKTDLKINTSKLLGADGHINLFNDENPSRIQPKDNREERKGVLQLGYTVLKGKPWYKRDQTEQNEGETKKREKKKRRNKKGFLTSLENEDPLVTIQKGISLNERGVSSNNKRKWNFSDFDRDHFESKKTVRNDIIKLKKEREEERRKRRRDTLKRIRRGDYSNDTNSFKEMEGDCLKKEQMTAIDLLRQKRLKREERERHKAEMLFKTPFNN